MRVVIITLVCVALISVAAAQKPDAEPKTVPPGKAVDTPKKSEVDAWLLKAYEAKEFEGMPYRLMRPIDFDSAKSYPLIVSLHGAGGRGTDNLKNIRVGWTGILARDELRREHPCFVVAPQTPNSWGVAGEKAPELSDETIKTYPEAWQKFFRRRAATKGEPGANRGIGGDLLKVFDLITALEKELPIDRRRVYVLGHSMGGMGTWNAIYEQPELFAAAIPTAGGLSPWKDPRRIANVPIWAFHGSVDPTVPVDFTRTVFAALKECGGNIKYTELKDVNHNLNLIAFDYQGDDEAKGWITQTSGARCDKENNLWDWLFKQKNE